MIEENNTQTKAPAQVIKNENLIRRLILIMALAFITFLGGTIIWKIFS